MNRDVELLVETVAFFAFLLAVVLLPLFAPAVSDR